MTAIDVNVFDGISDFDIDEQIKMVEAEVEEKMRRETEINQSSINGRQAANAIEGARVKQSPETSTEARESDKPSSPSA